jgi:hypothetical protein
MSAVKLTAIAEALDDSMEDFSWYVDTVNGKTIVIENGASEFVDMHTELLVDPDSSDAEIKELIEEDEWDSDYSVDELRELAGLSAGALIYIEPLSSREQYRIMEAFISTIDEERLRNLLYVAIEGSGAFRRFKDSLAVIGMLDEWYEYHDHVLLQRAVDWCKYQKLDYETAG